MAEAAEAMETRQLTRNVAAATPAAAVVTTDNNTTADEASFTTTNNNNTDGCANPPHHMEEGEEEESADDPDMLCAGDTDELQKAASFLQSMDGEAWSMEQEEEEYQE